MHAKNSAIRETNEDLDRIINLDDFNYELPKELIAEYPTKPRDHCNLLVLNTSGEIIHKKFYQISDYLKKGDVIVLNSTKVIKAKLVGKKESGSRAEIILTECVDNENNLWECHIKTRNPNPGMKILLGDGYALILKRKSIDEFIIQLSSKKLLKNGLLPNPPYIKHDVNDDEYQTIFAKLQGSLAAPTAGLHFTKRLLEKLKKKGVKIVYLTLHVGFGIFLPLPKKLEGHKTEPEYFMISDNAAKTINHRTGRLIVVGTTALKALESSSKHGKIFPASNESRIFIKPGHRFNSGAEILITNFHLPKSSLILLTSAFAGRKILIDAYNVAVKEKYRFYSLGDAMMILK